MSEESGYLSGEEAAALEAGSERALRLAVAQVIITTTIGFREPPTWATGPDWDKLREISDEAESLHEKGDMTPELYERLLERAELACNGHTEFIESLTHFAPPGAEDDE